MANGAKVSLTGRLIREPEQKNWQGTTVVSFCIAVNTTKKGADNKYESDLYNISVWGKPGEFILPRIGKGILVQVYGDLILQNYKDKKTGEDRQALSVRATDVIPLQKKDGNNANNAAEESSDPPPF